MGAPRRSCGRERRRPRRGRRRLRRRERLGVETDDQRAKRQPGVARRAFAAPTAQAADGYPEAPREFGIGDAELRPRKANQAVWHQRKPRANPIIAHSKSGFNEGSPLALNCL